MYRNNARDGRDMISANRLISKNMKKALNFRKVLENEGFEVSEKWASVKIQFGFGDFEGCFGVKSGIKIMIIIILYRLS